MHVTTDSTSPGSALIGAASGDIAVLYVARGGAGGLRSITAFANKLREHPAGIKHDLIFLAKNWASGERAAVQKLADETSAEVRWLPDDGFDWGAYFRIAPQLRQQWLCLLNTHSQPRVDGWLHMLHTAAAAPGVGLAGATGSWESARSVPATARKGYTDMLRGFASRIRHFVHLSHFPPFPNPHVRSTGLVIPRKLFVEFAAARVMPSDKHAAQRLESARGGLSSFVASQRLNRVVVGADGVAYLPQDWPVSRTFRSGDQGNLLIEDNRTSDYANATPALRRYLAQLAWNEASLGDPAQASGTQAVQRNQRSATK